MTQTLFGSSGGFNIGKWGRFGIFAGMKARAKRRDEKSFSITQVTSGRIVLTIDGPMRFGLREAVKLHRWLDNAKAPQGFFLEVRNAHYLMFESRARKLMLQHPLINKCAMITDNSLELLSGNVRHYLNSPSYPVRYFASSSKAKAWLDYC